MSLKASFPRRSRAVTLAIAALAMAPLTIGCAGVDDPGGANFTTVNARGKVSVAGKPAGPGIIIFEPLPDGGSAQQATGAVAADGTFELTSGGGKAGAMPGKYRVRIENEQGTKANKSDPATIEIPAGGGELDVQFPS